jgi:hypothetical protein
LNVLVFVLEISLGAAFVELGAFTPAHFTAFLDGSSSFQAVLTGVTSGVKRRLARCPPH